MKFLYYILPVVIASTVISCKKEELPELPDENDQYYSIKGLVDGDSVHWVVGLDQSTISFGKGKMNGIDTYYGQINSGSDDKAIRVEIIRPEVVYDGTTIAAIKNGQANYLVHKQGAIKFNFGMNYSQFDYVLVKNDMNDFIFSNQVTFDEYGIHNLVLKFTDYSSSESFNLPIRYGFEFGAIDPRFHSSSLGDTLIVTPETISGVHSWYINNQLESTEPVLQKELSDGIYEVRHLLKDLNGNEVEHTTLIRMKDGKHFWQMKYFYLSQEEPTSNYGKVLVSMHKDGVWYKSEHTTANFFKAFSISNIQTVTDGQFTPVSALFDFDFGTMLYNEDQSDSLSLPQMTGTLSVGLK